MSKLDDAIRDLRNNAITSLNLCGQKIGDEGAGRIADSLQVNNSLISLDLRNSNIGDEGAAAVAGSLEHNTILTFLCLGDNNIGAKGAGRIAESLLVNNSLISLDLRWNKIGDEGAAALLKALKNNVSLTEINLSGNNINQAVLCAINAEIQRIKQIPAEVKAKILAERVDKQEAERVKAERLEKKEADGVMSGLFNSLKQLKSPKQKQKANRLEQERLKKQEADRLERERLEKQEADKKAAEEARQEARQKTIEDAKTAYNQASKIIKNNPKGAITKLEKIINVLMRLKGDEQDDQIDGVLSLCYTASAKALKLLKVAPESIINALEGVLALGELTEESMNLASAMLEINPDASEVLRIYLGDKMFEQGNYAEALKYLKLGDDNYKKAQQWLNQAKKPKQPELEIRQLEVKLEVKEETTGRRNAITKILPPIQNLYMEANELYNSSREVEEKEQYFEEKVAQPSIETRLNVLQEATNAIKDDIAADNRIAKQDKALIQKQIDSILIKIEKTADKVDLDMVTANVKDLVIDGRIVKDRLSDLEDEIAISVKRSIEEQEIAVKRQLQEQQDILIRVINERLSQMQYRLDIELKSIEGKEKDRLNKGIQKISGIKQSIQGLFVKVSEHGQAVQGLTAEMTQLLKEDELNTDRFIAIQESLTVISTHEQVVQELTSEMTELLMQDELNTGRFIALQARIKGLEQELTNWQAREINTSHNTEQHSDIKLQEHKSNSEVDEPLRIPSFSPPQSPDGSRSPSPTPANLSKISRDIAKSVLKRVKGLLEVSNIQGASEQEEIFIETLAKELKKHCKKLVEVSNVSDDVKEDFKLAIADKLFEENEEKRLFTVEEVPLHVKEQGFKIAEALQRTKLFRIDNVKLNKKGYLKSLLEAVNKELVESINTEVLQIYAVTDIEYDNPVLKYMEALKEYYHKYGAKATNSLISIGHILTQGQEQPHEYQEAEVMGGIGNCFNDTGT